MVLRIFNFDAYDDAPRLLPDWVWVVARLSLFVYTLATLLALLLSQTFPQILASFNLTNYAAVASERLWSVLTPLLLVLPLILLFLPGLWRQLCPLATASQLAYTFGFRLQRAPNRFLLRCLSALSVAILVGLLVISSANIVWDIWSERYTVIALLSVLGLAFVLGFLLSGKSSFCATLCPLAHVETLVGQAPAVVVNNRFCSPCVNCVSPCYDFTPRAYNNAIFQEKRPVFRLLLIGLLPALIFAFWQAKTSIFLGWPLHLQAFALNTGSIWAPATLLLMLFPRNRPLLSAVFVAAGVILFYRGAQLAYAAQSPVGQVLQNSWFLWAIAACCSLFLMLVIVQDRRFVAFSLKGRQRETRSSRTRVPTAEQLGSAMCYDRKTRERILVSADETLASALLRNDILTSPGCQFGVCGCDIILIIDGADNLSPMTKFEADRLTDFGVPQNLLPSYRLACMVYVTGAITIDSGGKIDWPLSPEAPNIGGHEASLSVAIIGNGVAGMQAALALRKFGSKQKIYQFSQDNALLINKFSITKSLATANKKLQSLEILDEGWYKKHAVDLRIGSRVLKIDPKAKMISTHRGTVRFNSLVLAIGAHPQLPAIPGNVMRGVYAVTAPEILDGLQDWISKNGSQKHMSAVVVGGGRSGVETALALRARGFTTTLVHRNSHLMNRHVDPVTGQLIAAMLRTLGINVYLDTTPRAITGQTTVFSVEFANRDRVRASLVLFCLQQVPRKALVQDTNIAVDNGILVEPTMQVNMPDVYAIGDCAQINGVPYMPSWLGAQRMAEVAARQIMRDRDVRITAADLVSPYFMSFSGIECLSFGYVDQGKHMTRKLGSRGQWWRLITDNDGSLLGGNILNLPRLSYFVANAIVKKVPASELVSCFQSEGPARRSQKSTVTPEELTRLFQ